MRRFIVFISIAVLCQMLIIGCNDQISTQSNSPPPNDQELTAGTETISEKTKQPPHNRYMVIFKEQPPGIASSQAAQMAIEKTNAIFSTLNIPQDSLIHQYKWASQGFAGNFSKEQAERLRSDPRVEYVVKDFYYQAIQAVPVFKAAKSSMTMAQTTPWGVTRVGGPLDGTGTTAWILDTGIDLNHLDLNVNTTASASFVASEPADDMNGHGSHVAGTIAALNNSRDVVGVAAGASVVAVKVCDQFGGCYVSDVKAGVDYVAGNFSSGDVVNISLGWPTDDPDHPRIDIPLSDLENSITNAANGGLRFTIAAGNENQDANNKSPARVEHSNVWTVSAFDENDSFVTAFSCNPNYGSNYGNPPIEYSAPGNNVLSLYKNGGTATLCGTSMSAPHVAGLLLAADYGIDTDGTISNDPDGNSDPIAIAGQEPTLTVSISGPQFLNSGQSGTWSANVSYNDGPVSYQWFRRETLSDPWSSTGEIWPN